MKKKKLFYVLEFQVALGATFRDSQLAPSKFNPWGASGQLLISNTASHCGEIAELFIRDAATLLLHSARPCYALHALTTTSLRPTCFHGDCYLGIVNLGASATLLVFWPTPGLVQVLFTVVSLFWILGPILSSSILM